MLPYLIWDNDQERAALRQQRHAVLLELSLIRLFANDSGPDPANAVRDSEAAENDDR